jgi:hypothetical protein
MVGFFLEKRVQGTVLGVEDFDAFVDLHGDADGALRELFGEALLHAGVQRLAHALVHDGAATLGHAQAHVDEGVVTAQARRDAGRAAVGHGAVRGGVGEHARAAGGEDLFVLLVAHGEHGVGQRAAQAAHVDPAFRGRLVEVGGVEDDEVGHEGLPVYRRVATEV